VSFLPEVRPTWFFAVPRIWEKLKAGLESMAAGLPDEQREPLQQALDAAVEKVRLEQAGEPVPDELAQRVAKADEEIFSNLRVHLGLDQINSVNVGAAPTPIEVLEFFHAIGIPLAELWGMSETCGAGTVNPPDRIKLGTVGPATPGVEVKLAGDGEVLVRGGVVMLGYRNLPEQTAETLDADGWLRTGDIGVMDPGGNIAITDRKKDMFIVGGFNAYPAEIEGMLAEHPAIAQVAVVGVPDDRLGEVGMAYVIPRAGQPTPTPAEIIAWARQTMANYKAPRYVEIVDALPLNATGKVVRYELRERAAKTVRSG
jgi:long-subunit acyl-CoA synthetase (AMP-forming)